MSLILVNSTGWFSRADFFRSVLAFCSLLLLSLYSPTDAYAACSSPAGTVGQMQFDSSDGVMKYCDNTNWIEFPKAAGGGVLGYVQISTGARHSCAVLTDGTAMCWGEASEGRLGNGDTSSTYYKIPVAVNGGHSWQSISAGGYQTCGVRTDGAAMCWGRASSGQLGNGDDVNNQSAPSLVSGGHSWQSIWTGHTHTCGIRTDGAAMCWGEASSGKLGNGATTPNQNTPVLVNGSHTWDQITLARSHTCGVRTDNVGMCWGQASNGKLGNGDETATNYTSPVLVNGSHAWQSIWTGHTHTCGVRTDGVGMCWGSENGGQLGNGNISLSNVSAPGTVNGSHTWKSIAGGQGWSCGVRTDDVAMCWGGSGYLGDGSGTSNQSSPVLVAGSHSWDNLSTGYFHSCGVRTDGVGMCWGSAGYGKLGNDTISPDQVQPVFVRDQSDPATRADKGTAASKSHATSWTALSNVSMDESDTLLVCVATLGSVSGITWNGQAMTSNSSDTSSTPAVYIYSLPNVTAGTGDIIVNTAASTTTAITATSITATLASPFDQQSAAAGASGTAESSGATATTAQADEFLFGCMAHNGPSGDNHGGWLNSFVRGQRVGTTGNPATSNVTADDGYYRVYSTGNYSAEKNFSPNRDWAAAIATYKVESRPANSIGGSGCSSPTGVGGMMLYDSTANVLTYCNGGNWVESGPNPGTGGAGCSSPSGVAGMVLYDSSANVMTYCDGGTWQRIGK